MSIMGKKSSSCVCEFFFSAWSTTGSYQEFEKHVAGTTQYIVELVPRVQFQYSRPNTHFLIKLFIYRIRCDTTIFI